MVRGLVVRGLELGVRSGQVLASNILVMFKALGMLGLVRVGYLFLFNMGIGCQDNYPWLSHIGI
jgi:hypothetical protein